jgi:hypothetical protein
MTRLCCVFVLVTIGLGAQERVAPPGQTAMRIEAEALGTDHEAVYFQKLLNEQLARAGYAPPDVSRRSLTLMTTLSTPVVGGETRAYASAELRAADGRVVWSDDFPKDDGWRQARGRDALRKLAEEIAAAVARRPS